MSKIRVYELAKELNVSSKDLINLLMEEFGVEVKNHMSVIEDEDATLIKELLGDTSNSEGKKSLVDEYEEGYPKDGLLWMIKSWFWLFVILAIIYFCFVSELFYKIILGVILFIFAVFMFFVFKL